MSAESKVECNKVNMRLYVAALRSGKYKQGYGSLHTVINGVDQYCCLGIACETAISHGVKIEQELQKGKGEPFYTYDKVGGLLPPKVFAWLMGAVPDENANCCRNLNIGYDNKLSEFPLQAVTANDFHHMTFEQIADLIEAYYDLTPETKTSTLDDQAKDNLLQETSPDTEASLEKASPEDVASHPYKKLSDADLDRFASFAERWKIVQEEMQLRDALTSLVKDKDKLAKLAKIMEKDGLLDSVLYGNWLKGYKMHENFMENLKSTRDKGESSLLPEDNISSSSKPNPSFGLKMGYSKDKGFFILLTKDNEPISTDQKMWE